MITVFKHEQQNACFAVHRADPDLSVREAARLAAAKHGPGTYVASHPDFPNSVWMFHAEQPDAAAVLVD